MKRAFSLIEMMLVLTIISILMGTMKVHIQSKKTQADAKNIVECIKIYEAAITAYYFRNGGSFPADTNAKMLEEIEVLKPYAPTGFDSSASIHSDQCESIAIFDVDDFTNYGIEVIINNNKDLAKEITEELKDFSISTQVVNTTNSSTQNSVKFYLKKDANIYI